MVDATDSTLRERPEPFDGVRVNIPAYVHLRGVVNPPMVIASRLQPVVRVQFIRVDRLARKHALDNVRQQRGRLYARNGRREHATLTLHDPEYGRLSLVPF